MQEMNKVETPEIMLTLIQQLNYTATEKEVLLQKEESGSKVANLQGFLAGVRSYKNTIRHSGYILDDKFNGTDERLSPFFDIVDCTIKLPELRKVCADIDEVTSSDEYIAFKECWDDVVDDEKDRLFYFSEKGRDLHFAKGWYEAMEWVDDTIKRLKAELAQAEKDEAERLPF